MLPLAGPVTCIISKPLVIFAGRSLEKEPRLHDHDEGAEHHSKHGPSLSESICATAERGHVRHRRACLRIGPPVVLDALTRPKRAAGVHAMLVVVWQDHREARLPAARACEP